MEESKSEQGKDKLSATIPRYLKNRMVTEVDNNNFASVSEVATVAIAYFFGHYDQRIENETKKENSKRQSNQ